MVNENMTQVDTERKGDWGQSFTGQKFYPLDLRPEEVNITDIAHALSLVCRFGGHSKFHYSVAQHSVLVAHMVPRELQLEALMHDASEAYVCDIPRTFKSYLTGYKEIEDSVMRVIAAKYGFNFPMSPLVKEADNRMLVTEKYQVLNPGPVWEMEKDFKPYRNVVIEPMHPVEAEKLFIESFMGVTSQRTTDAFAQSLGKVMDK